MKARLDRLAIGGFGSYPVSGRYGYGTHHELDADQAEEIAEPLRKSPIACAIPSQCAQNASTLP